MHGDFEADRRRLEEALAAYRGADRSQLARWRSALAISLFAADFSTAQAVCAAATEQAGVMRVLDAVLAPAMHDIGTLWEHDEISVADEHVATEVALRLIRTVTASLHSGLPPVRPTIMLATPAPERHTLGLVMTDEVLRGAGYRTVLIGSGVGLDALVRSIERHRPALVGLSSTLAFPVELAATVTAIRESASAPRIVLGGAASALLAAELGVPRVAGVQDALAVIEQELGLGYAEPSR